MSLERDPADEADTASSPDGEERGGLPTWVPMVVVFLGLGGAVAFLLMGSDASEAFVYSKMVDEVVDSPEQFADRELRVEGDLRQGSIEFREEPCEWRFVLEKNDRAMPVRFPECVVPDTFRDGMGISVTVQGRLEPNGSFLANQVVPRCPSKYEQQQRLEAGEEIPHTMEPPGPSS